MNENAPQRHPETKPAAPRAEETSSVGDVMLAMVRSAKAQRIYLPNNPVLVKFQEELEARMTGHLERFGELKLDVEPFALKFHGNGVYLNDDPKDSMAFRIYSDGIRVLKFAPGLELRELTEFLAVLGFDPQSHQDDDIVTQLWEKNLPHITHLLEEDFAEVDAEEEVADQASQQEAISRIYAALAAAPPLPAQMIPLHLLMLTGQEAEWLRKARQAEVHRSPLEDVIYILSAVLSGTQEPQVFREFLDIMSKLAVNLFLASQVGQALKLVRFLDKLAKFGSLGDEQRLLVASAIAGILNGQTAHMLQETLDAGDSVSHEQLKEFLHCFGLPSLGVICELLGGVKKLKMRKVIVEVLVELGRGRPEVFSPFLADPRWFLVRNMVLVLSLLDAPEALEMVLGLVSHKEPRVRKEVLNFLERSPSPKAKTCLLKFLRDESSALRVRALQILSRRRHAFALRPVLALSTADDFKTRDLAEKKAIYEAIGELGSVRMLPMFRDMLLKKGWFMKGAAKETAICAVAGLAKINHAAARELLEEARRQWGGELGDSIDQAISAIAAGQQRAAAQRRAL